MKRLYTLLFSVLSILSVKADDFTESYNILSDEYIEKINDLPVIRNVNGGTVIIPTFDDSCPEEMKGPFSFACKIVEEYLPPCLPIRINICCEEFNGVSSTTVSKVKTEKIADFGNHQWTSSPNLTLIKNIILNEIDNRDDTFLPYLNSLDILTQKPDITISYNSNIIDEFSFTHDLSDDIKYDFVSVAIRDIFIGLGFSSRFEGITATKELIIPNDNSPFEHVINRALGSETATWFDKATQGSLAISSLPLREDEQLLLYAPEEWENGISLNYFIPQEDSSVSQVLAYNFNKGTKLRSLNDGKGLSVFGNFLGWFPYCSSTREQTETRIYGTTLLNLPYNGNITFDGALLPESASFSDNSQLKPGKCNSKTTDTPNIEKEGISSYIGQFNHFVPIEHDMYDKTGISLSILKKDGTWDVRYTENINNESLARDMWSFSMEDLNIQPDCLDAYATTADGRLRGRFTIKENEKRSNYKVTFFVIDHLPQPIKIAAKILTESDVITSADNSSATSPKVRIVFENLEGITQVIVEKLRKGVRIPTRIDVLDFKKGYLDTTIDRETTFTAIGYNANGTSRSLPVTVTLPTGQVSIEDIENNFENDISDIAIYSLQGNLIFETKNHEIDLPDLNPGIYIKKIITPQGVSTHKIIIQ